MVYFIISLSQICFGQSTLHSNRRIDFISADGGFSASANIKRPVREVLNSFEKYKRYTQQPDLKLFRTTKLKANELLGAAGKIKYKTGINPVLGSWYDRVKKLCQEEYLPKLPPVLDQNGVKLFFFNHYKEDIECIHGISQGKMFHLSYVSEDFYWSSGEFHYQSDQAKQLLKLARDNKEFIVNSWEKDRQKWISNFDKRWDGCLPYP